MTLKTSIRNLLRNLQETKSVKNPKNIQTDISFMTEEENFFKYHNNSRTTFNNQMTKKSQNFHTR